MSFALTKMYGWLRPWVTKKTYGTNKFLSGRVKEWVSGVAGEKFERSWGIQVARWDETVLVKLVVWNFAGFLIMYVVPTLANQ